LSNPKSVSREPIRILVLWTHVSGYMCENWRKLSSSEEILLQGIAWETSIAKDHVAFGLDVAHSLDLELVAFDRSDLEELVARRIQDFDPRVILVAGWGIAPYRRVLKRLSGGRCIVMGMDTPWRGRFQQHFAKYLLHSYLVQIDAVLAAGERSAEYARRLGFRQEQIFKGLYSWDEGLRERSRRVPKSERGEFLFIGRYVPQKGLATLVEAYEEYRSRVQDPWDLICCGAGPLKSLLQGRPGIQDMGFVAPSELPNYLGRASAFVLPSHYEPWGVAIAEAMGCGLPAIVSDACGAGLDLIESGVSGYVVKSGVSGALADCMVECHGQPQRLAEMAQRGQSLAQAYTSDRWAERFKMMLRQIGVMD
jgi:glycosyltransferase involved in cell wall biosynthesis